jgi:hypothetical protein
MKQRWDKYSTSMGEMTLMIDDFNENVNDSRIQKAFSKLVKKWAEIVGIHNEIDHLLDPIAAIEVKLPFETSEFTEMWKTYKEYMLETHIYSIRSRQEGILLGRLKRLSDNNAARATMMLELFISNGYKSIFKPSEKQLTGDEPTKLEDQQPSLDLNKKPVL